MHDGINITLYELLKPQEDVGFRIDGPIKGHCGIVYKVRRFGAEGETIMDIVEVYPNGAKPHYHKKAIELYNLLKGGAILYVGNKPIDMEVGQPAAVIKPRQVHKIVPRKADEETILQVVSIPKSFPNDSFSPDGKLL